MLAVAGSLVSLLSLISLSIPGSILEPMWRLNPRARVAFASMGAWSFALMAVVCLGCTLSAIGLWQGRIWGYRLAVGGLIVNLVGDVVNTIVGTDRRAVVGIPIVLAILVYLASQRVRSYFRVAVIV